MRASGVAETIGLIAGSHRFPLLLAERARIRGYRVAAAALVDLACADIGGLVDAVEWVRLGELERLIGFFRREGVTRAYMAGAVRKADLLSLQSASTHLRDDRAAQLWFHKLSDRRDATILAAFADELASEGVHLQNSVELLADCLASPGCMTVRRPSPSEMLDLAFGLGHVRELARMDIGQTVVVRDRCVVAVEAVEGTDECIRRAARLAGPGCVAVKCSRPDQDMRFDVPCVGEQTVAVCRESDVAVIGLESGRTLMIDKERTIGQANAAGVAIMGLTVGA